MPRPPTPQPASSRSKKHSQLCQIRKSSRYTIQCSPNQITRNEKYNTPKGLSRKQAIIPTSDKIKNTIMGEANTHIFQINMLLKNIKSAMRAKFICPCSVGVSINTNSVPNTSNLNTIERYLKSINGVSNDKILVPRLSQSKSYLKITGIPYI